jgi:hypothetical protein
MNTNAEYEIELSDGSKVRVRGALLIRAGGLLAVTTGGDNGWSYVLAAGQWKSAKRLEPPTEVR